MVRPRLMSQDNSIGRLSLRMDLYMAEEKFGFRMETFSWVISNATRWIRGRCMKYSQIILMQLNK
jgi:hypothetical protein